MEPAPYVCYYIPVPLKGGDGPNYNWRLFVCPLKRLSFQICIVIVEYVPGSFSFAVSLK